MLINKQAEELNSIIIKSNPAVFQMLSEKGKSIYFPKEGIIAQSAQAKGKKFNATIGIAVEDDASPMRLNSISSKVLLDPKEVFVYAPSQGKPELREEWKKQILGKNASLKNQISLPLVTNALTHGLSIVGYMFANEGDKIILSDLFWGNYKLIFSNAYGAELETFNTFKEGLFDVESMKQKLSGGGKKILLLNFPNNPCGYTPTKKEAQQIINAIRECSESGNKIVVILDDAYFGLFFEEETQKESLFAALSLIHENVLAIKIDGATKEDYVWGLRVGFITYGFKGATPEAYKALEDKTAGAIRGSISNVPNISQSLVLNAFKASDYKKEKQEKFEILKQRYLEVKRVINNEKYKTVFEPLPFNSGYFMCVKPKKTVAEKVRLKLLEKYDTGVISIGNLLRVSFSSLPAKNIEQVFENIYLACKECEVND